MVERIAFLVGGARDAAVEAGRYEGRTLDRALSLLVLAARVSLRARLKVVVGALRRRLRLGVGGAVAPLSIESPLVGCLGVRFAGRGQRLLVLASLASSTRRLG